MTMLVELGRSGEIKLTKVPFFWSELWNKLSIVRLVNFHFQCRTWKSVHPWIIILWVYIVDISHRWKWFYPRIIALISSRGSKQFNLRLIVLGCQRSDRNNSTRGSYCFSIEPQIETIWSAVTLFQCQAAHRNNSIRGSYCFTVKPRIETILSVGHIVLLSSHG